MGGTMSNLDWVALPMALIAYFYEFSISARWTDANLRMRYRGWEKILNSFLAFPGWAFQPILFLMQSLASVAIFLFWRNNFTSSSSINFDLVMGFTVANVVFLKMWTPSMLWGPGWWWLAAVDSFFVLASALGVLTVMGIEGAWLPFGLYILFPVLSFVIMCVSIYFWWNGTRVQEELEHYAATRGKRSVNRAIKREVEIVNRKYAQPRQNARRHRQQY